MPDFATIALIIFLSVLHGRAARMGTLSMVLLRLPSTLLHELAHFLVGLVTFSGVSSFSLWPKRVDGGWILGSVQCRRLGPFSCFLVGLAPALVCLPAACWIFQLQTLSGYIGSFLLLTASVPSGQDIKVAFSSLVGSLFWLSLMALSVSAIFLFGGGAWLL